MTEPPPYQELLEKHSRVLLLLESAQQEIKRQGEIIEAFKKRFFGSSSERLDPLQVQLAFPDEVLGKCEPLSAKTSGQGGGGRKRKKWEAGKKAPHQSANPPAQHPRGH